MKTIKFASRTGSEKEELKRKYVQLREEEKSNREAAEIVGFSRSTGCRLADEHKTYGDSAYTSKNRGRRRKLTKDQETEIKNRILTNAPDEASISLFLWSKKAIKLLIENDYEFELPLSTVADYLKRWKIVAPKPDRSVLIKNSKIDAWLKKRNKIQFNYTNKETNEIHWCFEEINIITKNEVNINMIASISNQGMFRFLLYEGEIDKKTYKNFRNKLLRECDKDLCLILYSKNKRNYTDFTFKQLKAKLFKISI